METIKMYLERVIINLYLDLILHLQGQVLKELVSWSLCVCFTLGDMQVPMCHFLELCHICVTNIWKRVKTMPQTVWEHICM